MKKNEMKKVFSKRIKEIRKEYNLTQEELGKNLGVTGATISLIESSQNLPSTKLLLNLEKKYSIGFNFSLGSSKEDPSLNEKLLEIQIINKQLEVLPLEDLRRLRKIISLVSEISPKSK